MDKIKLEKCKCKRCGKEWYPRPNEQGIVEKPICCAKCKSAYWDREEK